MCFVLIVTVIKTTFQEHRQIMLIFVINSVLLNEGVTTEKQLNSCERLLGNIFI